MTDPDDLLRRLGRDASSDEQATAKARARAALEGAIRAEQVARRRGRSRRITVVAGIAAAIVICLVVVGFLLPGGTGLPVASADPLDQLARTATQHPLPTAGPGQYVYARERGRVTQARTFPDGTVKTKLIPYNRESWVASDGSGLIIVNGESDHFGPGELISRDFASLPTDPEALYRAIHQRNVLGAVDNDGEVFNESGNLLREANAPTAIRSAVFRMLGDLPGVESDKRAHDASGRPAIGIIFEAAQTRSELFFDRKTSYLLGEEQWRLPTKGNENQPQRLLDSRVYSAPTIVDRLGRRVGSPAAD